MATFETIKEWCTRKLAHVLYECMEVAPSCEDRALLDWNTAESIVNDHPYAITHITRLASANEGFNQRPLDEGTFDVLFGRTVFENLYQQWRCEVEHGGSQQSCTYTRCRFD